MAIRRSGKRICLEGKIGGTFLAPVLGSRGEEEKR